MAMLPMGVGGMLFGGGGGSAGAEPVHVGGGKNAKAQNLGSPHSGLKNTVTKGDPMSRAMGHYGKGHAFGAPSGGLSGASPLKQIRGGTGQMRRIRGGLGPGKMGTAGPSGDYSMKNADTE